MKPVKSAIKNGSTVQLHKSNNGIRFQQKMLMSFVQGNGNHGRIQNSSSIFSASVSKSFPHMTAFSNFRWFSAIHFNRNPSRGFQTKNPENNESKSTTQPPGESDYQNAVQLASAKNLQDAFALYQKAAQEGHRAAQRAVGVCYIQGQGVEKDLDKALEWLVKSAESKNPQTEADVAACLVVLGRHEEACKWLEKAAKQGHAISQYNLGVCYQAGLGVPLDKSQAKYYLEQAASQGQPNAYFSLAMMYYDEEIPQDESKMFQNFRNAAQNGMSEALHYLAECYFLGRGTQVDYPQAIHWWTKAAQRGVMGAQMMLGKCYYGGLGVEADLAKAKQWTAKFLDQLGKKAAKSKDPRDIFQMGYALMEEGPLQNLPKALEWLEQASKLGHTEAQYYAGYLLLQGEGGVAEDPAKAVPYLQQAADANHNLAMFMLGCLYMGQAPGVAEDKTKAFQYFTKAAEQGSAPAAYNLGCCYLEGAGVEKNEEEAVRWFHKAAEGGDISAQERLAECYEHGTGVPQDARQAEFWMRKVAAATANEE